MFREFRRRCYERNKRKKCYLLPAEYNRDSIVQNTFAEHEGVEINVDMQIVEYRDDRERIGGRYQSPEVERVQKRERLGQMRYQLDKTVHQRAEKKNRTNWYKTLS